MKDPHLPTAEAEANNEHSAEARPRAWDDFDLGEQPGFVQRHRGWFVGLAVLVGGGLVWFWNDLFPAKAATTTRREALVLVSTPPPPPPPPPVVTPPPPPPPEEKMIEQTPVENEPKPDPTPDEPPPADVATGIAGNGPPDAFGLSDRGGNGLPGGNGGNRAAQRSRWGWYASQVQSRIQQAVQTNRATRSANLRVDVQIWADANGRITRAALTHPSGNATVDAALRDQVLTGLQLSEPPPADMPMPIALRVTARRPN